MYRGFAWRATKLYFALVGAGILALTTIVALFVIK